MVQFRVIDSCRPTFASQFCVDPSHQTTEWVLWELRTSLRIDNKRVSMLNLSFSSSFVSVSGFVGLLKLLLSISFFVLG